MSLLLMLLLSVTTTRASDAVTAVPEQGSVSAGRYRNAYFHLSYPIPAGCTEQPAGSPPSKAGAYALAQFALIAPEQRLRAHVLITAQDFFFSLIETDEAKSSWRRSAVASSPCTSSEPGSSRSRYCGPP